MQIIKFKFTIKQKKKKIVYPVKASISQKSLSAFDPIKAEIAIPQLYGFALSTSEMVRAPSAYHSRKVWWLIIGV